MQLFVGVSCQLLITCIQRYHSEGMSDIPEGKPFLMGFLDPQSGLIVSNEEAANSMKYLRTLFDELKNSNDELKKQNSSLLKENNHLKNFNLSLGKTNSFLERRNKNFVQQAEDLSINNKTLKATKSALESKIFCANQVIDGYLRYFNGTGTVEKPHSMTPSIPSRQRKKKVKKGPSWCIDTYT